MNSRLHCYAITAAALRALCGGENIPAGWFNWTLPLVSLPGGMSRLRVLQSLRYADNEAWAQAACAEGLAPFIIVSVADRMTADDWPLPTSWLTPIGSHCIDDAEEDECRAVAAELASPDEGVQGQWDAIRVGVRADVGAPDVPAALLLTYADALSTWCRSAAGWMHWDGEVHLEHGDFVGWPEHPPAPRASQDLFIPLRNLECSGVGFRDGRPAAFGLLSACAEPGNWCFGDHLRMELAELLCTSRSAVATVLVYTALLGTFRVASNLSHRVLVLRDGQRGAESEFVIDLAAIAAEAGAEPEVVGAWRDVYLSIAPHRRLARRHVVQLHPAGTGLPIAAAFIPPGDTGARIHVALAPGQTGALVAFPEGFDPESWTVELKLSPPPAGPPEAAK